jgi:hypothetical protein
MRYTEEGVLDSGQRTQAALLRLLFCVVYPIVVESAGYMSSTDSLIHAAWSAVAAILLQLVLEFDSWSKHGSKHE